MAKRKSKRKLKTIKVKIDLDKALGRAHREAYLDENPHGFRASQKIHKSKNAYNRKAKHKNRKWRSDEDRHFLFVL